MAIAATLLSQDIKVLATGKIAQLWNSAAEFWIYCLTHKNNFNAVVINYISVKSCRKSVNFQR